MPKSRDKTSQGYGSAGYRNTGALEASARLHSDIMRGVNGQQIFTLVVIVIIASTILKIVRAGSTHSGTGARMCSSCGAQHPHVARFCRMCGRPLRKG